VSRLSKAQSVRGFVIKDQNEALMVGVRNGPLLRHSGERRAFAVIKLRRKRNQDRYEVGSNIARNADGLFDAAGVNKGHFKSTSTGDGFYFNARLCKIPSCSAKISPLAPLRRLASTTKICVRGYTNLFMIIF
jgi:hypothetical protein